MNKLRTWAARQNDPFLQFAANPQFDESFDRDSGKLVLASHLESYTVTTSPARASGCARPSIANSSTGTRSSTRCCQAGPPPEPRLRLNEALARHKVVPLKVELTRAGEKEPIRAEHDFTWRLSQDDCSGSTMSARRVSYREVTNEEFLQGTQPEKPAK